VSARSDNPTFTASYSGSRVDRERSDTELLTAIRAGDDTAWAELVRRYAGRIWATARAQSLSPELASDVVQTVWLVLLDQISMIRNDESIRFWLTTVARHEAIRVSKSQRRLGSDAALPYLADPTSSAGHDLLERTEQAESVRQAMRQISERCRELLHLLFSEAELSYREIADMLDRPIGSLGAQRARCLDELRGVLRV
jgi:RNA polymerase sigma factor (sigma-70 family)